jgi:hypothetical protein
MNRQLVAYLSMPMPRRFQSDRFRDDLYAVLAELLALSDDLELRLFYAAGPARLHLELVRDPHSDPDLREYFGPDFLDSTETLACTADVSVSKDLIESLTNETADSVSQIVDTLLRQEYEKRMYDIIWLANLARPGSLELANGIISSGDGWHHMYHRLGAFSLREAIKHATSSHWPPIQELPFRKAWDWGESMEGFADGFSDSAITRALTALTHIMDADHNDPQIRLFWAMVGIEALYSRGRESVMEQLREKSRLLLGVGDTSRRDFTRMYDFRSEFVHGRRDFEALLVLGDARPEVGRFAADLINATQLAIAILVATLQEVIRREWTGLHFEYIVTEAPPRTHE